MPPARSFRVSRPRTLPANTALQRTRRQSLRSLLLAAEPDIVRQHMERRLRPGAVRAISVVATYALVGAVLALYFRGNLFSALPPVIVLQVLAGLLMLWARLTFGMRSFHVAATPTVGPLVTTGPYRLIRHPIYAAIWLFTWAGAAAHPTVVTISLATLVALALLTRLTCEEFFLRAHFSGYAAYAAHTSRLVPFVF